MSRKFIITKRRTPFRRLKEAEKDKYLFFISWQQRYVGETNRGFGSGTYYTDTHPRDNIEKFLDEVEKFIAVEVRKEHGVHLSEVVILNFIEV